MVQAGLPAAQAGVQPQITGPVWGSAHWANGSSRTLGPGDRDMSDPTGWSEAVGPSGSRAHIDGDGVMTLSGNQPRLYINSREFGGREFDDVEVTAYYRRVDDDNTSWGGLTIGARSGGDAHGSPNGDDCDAHTYYMRFMNNGAVDFDKELAHPNHSSRERKSGVFGNSLPFDEWIGGKFRIYNLPNGHVKLEAYADFGDGEWRLVNETVDDGTWASEDSASDCSRWNTDRDIYTGSGLVFIRNTGVDRAEYRDLSVREIGPGGAEPEAVEPMTAPFRVNAGGAELTDSNGDTWQADQAYSAANRWGYILGPSRNGGTDHGVDVAGTDDDELFSTERWGMSAYRFDLEDGDYDVRLHFAETYHGVTAAGDRVFSLAVEDTIVSSALDVFAESSFGTPLVKEVRNVQVRDGRLDIGFEQDGAITPMIKGIEVLEAGTLDDPSAPSPEPEPAPAVAVPFRANAGGSALTDANGYTWQADQAYGSGNGWGYLLGPTRNGGTDHGVDVAGTDDDELFSTERWGMSAYRIDLEDGDYDVRLHFAETYAGVTAAGDRVFSLAVGDIVVFPALDVFAESGFGKSLVKEVRNVQVRDKRLDIKFEQDSAITPMVKGIEVLEAGTLSDAPPSCSAPEAMPTHGFIPSSPALTPAMFTPVAETRTEEPRVGSIVRPFTFLIPGVSFMPRVWVGVGSLLRFGGLLR
ncbi:MAG: malectin domain-containing carbohydrate-binding protein [Dehalococcoidia bacterium]